MGTTPDNWVKVPATREDGDHVWIDPASITLNSRGGRLSLQVPDGEIGPEQTVRGRQSANLRPFPRRFFCRLKSKGPALGRESGSLHLTREGYRHFRAELLGRTMMSPEEQDAAAEAHFRRVDARVQAMRTQLAQRMRQLDEWRT